MPRILELSVIALLVLMEGLGVWLLMGCPNRELRTRDKLLWLVVLIPTTWVGAMVYYFLSTLQPTRDLRHPTGETIARLQRGLNPHVEGS